MGMDATAIIAYGIAIKEDSDIILPWVQKEDEDEDEEDETDWWLKEVSYTSPFEVYDRTSYNGYALINGVKPTEDQINQYWTYRNQWLAENMPFEVIYFGSEYAEGKIITSPKYPKYDVDWGSITFDPADLIIEVDEAFESFIKKYFPTAKPTSWILAAKYS